jgi:ElaB/YqjD/DUF883 family membrane-anchored ribosome-binding protein
MTSQKTYPYEDATDRARGVADVTSDRLKDAGDKAQQMAYDMAEQTRQYGQKVQDAARQFKPFVERSMKDQPMATLAGAALIGFVLGALWKK